MDKLEGAGSAYDGSGTPVVLSRRRTVLSAWVTVVEKRVQFEAGEGPETYHSLELCDYVVALAKTPSGLIPIVRQFRPAIEEYTWELPAGLVEPGEDPKECCVRELKEEAGVVALRVQALGTYWIDSGRMGNKVHAYFIEASEPDRAGLGEPSIDVVFVTPDALKEYILTGRFNLQLHITPLLLASLHGIPWA